MTGTSACSKKRKSHMSLLKFPETMALFDVDDEIANRCSDSGIAMLRPGDANFPQGCRRIAGPPRVLYAKGNPAILNDPAIAIIGTRTPTPRGSEIAEQFGRIVAGEGFVVVSGLALGCDAGGHRGCLAVGGRTVAVVAHGLDRVYPPQHKGLAAQIAHEGGCLLSQYPPGIRTAAKRFVERDRIQSALSAALIVIETDLTGGTMHTVRFARDHGKPLAALAPPHGSEDEPMLRGNRQLLESGAARPIRDGDDLRALIVEWRRIEH